MHRLSLHVPHTIQAWHGILPRLSSLGVSPESRPSEISGREIDEVVVFTGTVIVNITDNPYQYQHLHVVNCTRVSRSMQKLYRASCRALVTRRMRGLGHCWILDC
jgi:hypothetical protein